MRIVAFLFVLSFGSAVSQPEHEFLAELNKHRRHPVEYLASEQPTLTAIAAKLPKVYGHVYGNNHSGEIITRASSPEAAMEMFLNSRAHKRILKSKKAKFAAVGMYSLADSYYLIVRFYDRPR